MGARIVGGFARGLGGEGGGGLTNAISSAFTPQQAAPQQNPWAANQALAAAQVVA